MRSIVALAATLLLTGCPLLQDDSIPVTQCEAVRPQVCTMEYNPVCAITASGAVKTYASPCNACADDKVSAHQPGACPE